MGQGRGKSSATSVSEDSSHSRACSSAPSPSEWTLLATSASSDPCLDRLFSSHTQWLQLLTSQPAFLARLDPQDLLRLSSLLESAKLAVDSAALDGCAEESFSTGRSVRRSSAWESLPCGVAANIFNRLAPHDAATARLVCVPWSRQLCSGWPSLQPRTPPTPGWAATFSGLRRLNLWNCRHYLLTEEDTQYLTDLQELRLAGNATAQELGALKHLKSLTSLNLCRCYDVTDEGVASLASLSRLTSVNLSSCFTLTDRALEALQPLTALSRLDISGCYDVTDTGVKALSPLTNLLSLNLAHCIKVGDSGVASLSPLSKVKTLNLESSGILTDRGLFALESLTSITDLSLGRADEVTDEGLSVLEHLTNLRSLRISGFSKA